MDLKCMCKSGGYDEHLPTWPTLHELYSISITPGSPHVPPSRENHQVPPAGEPRVSSSLRMRDSVWLLTSHRSCASQHFFFPSWAFCYHTMSLSPFIADGHLGCSQFLLLITLKQCFQFLSNKYGDMQLLGYRADSNLMHKKMPTRFPTSTPGGAREAPVAPQPCHHLELSCAHFHLLVGVLRVKPAFLWGERALSH